MHKFFIYRTGEKGISVKEQHCVSRFTAALPFPAPRKTLYEENVEELWSSCVLDVMRLSSIDL